MSLLVDKLNVETSLEELPSVESLKKAGAWSEADELKLTNIKTELSAGSGVQARRTSGITKEPRDVAGCARRAVALFDEAKHQEDLQLLKTEKTTVEAAQAALALLRDQNLIPSSGGAAWK